MATEINLINIQQLPAANAGLNNPIMFGIGEVLHKTPLSQIKTLIGGDFEQDIIELKKGTKVFLISTDYEGLTFSEAVKSGQDARQIARDFINQQPIFTVPNGFLPIVKIAFQAETTQIIDGVPQVVLHTLEQQTILNTGAREYGVGTPPVTSNDFTVLTSTFSNPQTLIDLSSQIFNEAGLISADLEAIRNIFNDAPNCVIRSSAVVTATVGNTTRNWLFTGGEGMWGVDAKQALRDDMFFEIEKTDSVFKPQHNSVLFDKNYNIGTPTTPATGVLTADLSSAKVGSTVLMYYSGASLPPFVTQWLQGTDDNFVANETCYLGLHLHKLDGANSVITGVVNNL